MALGQQWEQQEEARERLCVPYSRSSARVGAMPRPQLSLEKMLSVCREHFQS